MKLNNKLAAAAIEILDEAGIEPTFENIRSLLLDTLDIQRNSMRAIKAWAKHRDSWDR